MTFRAPAVAPTVERFSVIWVGLVYVTLLTVTPDPETDAARRLAKPAPGSKKPEPAELVPVIVTFTDACPELIVDGDAEAIDAGGGAISLAIRTAYEFDAWQYCWIVHIVISSSGSTLVYE